MTHPTIPATEVRADQLKPGDWVAELIDGDPWAPKRRDAEILSAHPYVDEVKNARVLLVAQVAGESGPDTERPLADMPVRLLSDAERAAMREQAERAQKIADIRAFADWLEANPAVPAPWQVQADEHLSLGDGTEIERLAKVRQVAAMLGVEADERLTDHTEVEFKIGDLVKYSLIAWHKGGRPVEPVEDVRCGTCGESLREIERGTLGHIPGEACAPADDLGFGYSRELDDPTPVSPARPPAHVGDAVSHIDVSGVREGAEVPVPVAERQLVDETPASGLTPAADESRGPLAGTTPVVTYFSFGYGQTDPDTGKQLIDHYVTVVAPTYEQCREAMFSSRFGRAWSFDYLAGHAKTTEWVSQWTEHEVIVAPGTDPALAEAALKAAAAVLAGEHEQASSWIGPSGLGTAGALCACGLRFDGFDTLAEVHVEMGRHIETASAVEPVSEAR